MGWGSVEGLDECNYWAVEEIVGIGLFNIFLFRNSTCFLMAAIQRSRFYLGVQFGFISLVGSTEIFDEVGRFKLGLAGKLKDGNRLNSYPLVLLSVNIAEDAILGSFPL